MNLQSQYNVFIPQNAFENFVYNIVSILFRLHGIKWNKSCHTSEECLLFFVKFQSATFNPTSASANDSIFHGAGQRNGITGDPTAQR